MASLVGDLLRSLVHTGLQVGGHTLGQLITMPMVTKRQEQLQEARELYQSSAGASEPAKAAISERLQKIRGFGLPTAMEPTGKMIGPEGQITGPMTPRPGVQMSPELQQRFVGAPPSLNQLLGKAAGESPELLLHMLGVKAGTEQTAGQQAALDLRERLGVAGQEIQRMRAETSQQLGLAKLEQTYGNMQRLADRFEFDKYKFEQEQKGKEKERQTKEEKDREAKYLHYLDKLHNKLRLTDKDKNSPEVVTKAALEANAIFDSIPEDIKDRFKGFTKFEFDEPTPGYFGTSVGAKPMRVKAPGGMTTPPAAAPAGAPPTSGMAPEGTKMTLPSGVSGTVVYRDGKPYLKPDKK